MMLLDSGVITTGDGALLAGALITLLVACWALPIGMAAAWSMLVHFVEGESGDS